ncbi:minor capsid protein [Clostridium butyricum]|uniref:minor capsid protein n=1 Tax=Clostridium butyricum TaxID=1492 RepID=UPI002330EFBF|nr:minor capsid protein [Clostridium butyricum]MDB2160080.1 minor capsid protein [Clostridium butyricum]
MKYIQDLSEEQEEYYFLELSLTSQLYNKYVAEVNKQVEKVKDENNTLLASLIALISSLGDILNVDTDKLNNIEKQINSEIDKFIQNQKESEIRNIQNIVQNVIKEEFKINNYLQSIGLEDFQIQNISTNEIMDIVNAKINNKTFEDRINDNKDSIGTMILASLSLFLAGDVTQEKLLIELEKNLKLNDYMTSRLGTNEVMRNLVEASELWKQKAGIEKEIYCSVLERNTCSVCMGLHGTIYDVNDKNKPVIPMHVKCKCKYITIPSSDWKNKTGEIKGLEDIMESDDYGI